jgi:hypothetical protein
VKAIVGARDLWLTSDVVSILCSILSSMREDEVVAIRAPRSDATTLPASPVERFIQELAPKLGHGVQMYAPSGKGRAATFFRDYDLVDSSDGVYAFFAPEAEMEGGTGHVVQAALNRHKTVEAWTLDVHGHLVFIGSDETEGIPDVAIALRQMREEARTSD